MAPILIQQTAAVGNHGGGVASGADLAAIAAAIRDVPDFPLPGILYRDITPLLADPQLFGAAVERLAQRVRACDAGAVLAVESRGFLFGAPVALALGLPLIVARKAGKLPGATIDRSYGLEYGSDRLELHRDALTPGCRVVIMDDLLATGGTVAAAAALARDLGAEVVGAVFLIILDGLRGVERLSADGISADALLHY